jgi:hypothetical protein
MSTEQDQAREIAERIARRVSAESSPSIRTQQTGEMSSELAAVRAGLSELQRKISQLEAKISPPGNSPTNLSLSNTASLSHNPQTTPTTHSPWLAGINSSYSHPSQEKFGVEEATVAELVDFFEKEKTCSVEPGGKPCDHCAMCSSRGF